MTESRKERRPMRLMAGFLVLAGLMAVLAGCERNADDDIVDVKERHEAQLMAIPGVVGVGIGEAAGEAVIVVYVEKRTPQIEQDVPKELEGYPVVVEVSGPIVAYSVPATAPYIQGRITAIDHGGILVEENPSEDDGSAKAYLRITERTRILLRRSGEQKSKSDLRIGHLVRAWVSGPVAESYPVQAEAAVIEFGP